MNNINKSIVDANDDLLTLDLDLLDLIVGGDGNGAAPFPPMPTQAPPKGYFWIKDTTPSLGNPTGRGWALAEESNRAMLQAQGLV